MRMQYKPRVTTAVASISVLALAAVSVQGVGAVAAGANGAAHAEAAQAKAQAQVEQAQQRLSDNKLRVCQTRETAIKNIMTRLADRGQKQLNLFTGIADKTETFYTNKGKTLSNYAALVNDVNTKKAAAETTVNTIRTESTGFSCTSDDPKGFMSTFKTSLADEIQALKDYKTAVKNLIVGVKSVESTTSSTDSTKATTGTSDSTDSTDTSSTSTSTTGGQR